MKYAECYPHFCQVLSDEALQYQLSDLFRVLLFYQRILKSRIFLMLRIVEVAANLSELQQLEISAVLLVYLDDTLQD